MEKRFRLLQAGEVYGLWHYASMFAARVGGRKEYANEAMKVYAFKRNKTGAGEVRRMVEAVASHFGCDAVVAVPGHAAGLNALQETFGAVLRRTSAVPSRKYAHKAEIDFERESATLELDAGFEAKRALVVDDVCTTGKSMAFYRDYFAARGVECVLLALGVNWKLNPVECDDEISYTVAEAKSGAQLSREHEDRAACIDAALAEAREKVNHKRRNAAERSLLAWIKTYCVGVLLNDPPPSPHGEKILREMEEAVGSSRPYQILVARGGGKTSYTECFVAYALATGLRRFCLISSINAKQAQQILRETTAVFTSEPFATDYPDIALPIALLDGHGRRSQRQGGHDTKVRIVTDETMLPTVTLEDGSPSRASGACIRAKALKSVRGTKNGTQRPDLVVLDDLQTREVAENEERVAGVLSLIRGDVMGLAGKGKAAIISTATTIASDDLTERLGADKSWKTTRNPAVIRWPDEWKRDGHGLWGEYFAMYTDENRDDLKHTRRGGSLDFYRAHRAEMDKGADILNWDNYSRRDGQASGLQKLLDAYLQMGHEAFMAEYQMEPVRRAFAVDLSARVIMSRVRKGVAPGTLLDGAVFTACATDINPSYALTTVWASFDVQRTCLVGGYGIHRIHIDDSATDTEYHQRVFNELAGLAQRIRASGVRLNAWGIDASGKQFDAVTRFASVAERQFGVKAVAMTGRAGKNWNPNVRSRVRAALNGTVMCRDERTARRWLAFNADEWKESAQRSWFAEAGAPGGCSLFDGGASHAAFAEQVANERLAEKRPLPGGGGYAYRWKTKEPHDFGDCMAMVYALAGADGLNGDGCRTAPRHRRKVYGEQ